MTLTRLLRPTLRSGLGAATVGLPLVLAALLALGSADFRDAQNLGNFSGQIAALLIAALGQLLVTLIGGIDLSVGSVISLASAIVATQADPAVGVLLALLMGLVVGLVNGAGITLAGVHPLVMTLGSATFLQGLAHAVLPIPGGRVSKELGDLASGSVMGLPLSLLWCLLDAQPALLLLALLGSLSGYGAAHWQLTRPDPLTPWIGAKVTLTGHWDGQFLTTQDPKARVALSPKPRQHSGTLVVSGQLERPEGQRTPGGFDQAAWLRAQGGVLLPTPTAVLVKARVRKSHEDDLHGWFRRGLSAGLGQQQAALMQAIELGDRGDIGREEFRDGLSVRDAFGRAGLAHLMALSGQNVALLVGALLLLLGPVVRQPALRFGIPLALLLVYLFVLVGVSPSITRAVLMGGVALMASVGPLLARLVVK